MAKQTFVADTILTAAQMNALQGNDYNQTVSTKTASYTLVASDAGTKIVMNAGATNTTITVNTSLFSAGDTLTILNTSTSGTCTITAGTATVSTTGTLALVQNAGGTLYFTSAGVSVFLADGVAESTSYTTYTPTFTGLTIGNGTISVAYANIGGAIHLYGIVTLGSTSSVNAAITMTTPTTQGAIREWLGQSFISSSGGSYFSGFFNWLTTTTIGLQAHLADGTYLQNATISATVPLTWNTSSSFSINCMLRAA